MKLADLSANDCVFKQIHARNSPCTRGNLSPQRTFRRCAADRFPFDFLKQLLCHCVFSPRRKKPMLLVFQLLFSISNVFRCSPKKDGTRLYRVASAFPPFSLSISLVLIFDIFLFRTVLHCFTISLLRRCDLFLSPSSSEVVLFPPYEVIVQRRDTDHAKPCTLGGQATLRRILISLFRFN